MLNKKQQKFLLNLARESIKTVLYKTENITDIKVEDPIFKEHRAVFVTLTKNGRLRGCIGHILPVQEMYFDVVENAVSAGFKDPRFKPLEKKELSEIKIEISLLSKPERLPYEDAEDLLKKINSTMGIIIESGPYRAVFLPQVWEKIPKKENFLTELCLKAGFEGNFWRFGELDVKKFTAENFEEE